MKKKERTSKTLVTDIDLKTLIQKNSQFLDKLVELIPARFYLPVEDDSKPWFQGLSKEAKASAKKDTRENIKKARRDRLDPEKSSGTLDLLKKNLEENEEKEKEEDSVEVVGKRLVQREGSLTYEELRGRFDRRMEELRKNRKVGLDDESNRQKKRQNNQAKRKRDGYEHEVKKKKKVEEGVSDRSAKTERDVYEAAENLTFGHVKIGDEDENGRKKKKKLSKLQALEKAKKLEELKRDPEKGDIVAKKHSWTAAMSRALGIKVHDDPKLIKVSIRKEKKRHEKNVGKWKDRIDSVEKVRTQKQKARSENIAQRAHQKKMRKIEKREKKLMRPGFEGRNKGFIDESK